jgi:hypothetical protein
MKVLGIIALSTLAFGVTFRSTVGCSDDTVVNIDAGQDEDDPNALLFRARTARLSPLPRPSGIRSQAA